MGFSSGLYAQYAAAPDNPQELGKVSWIRNYEEAKLKSRQTDKDIFVLFQEVPGCHTCTTYGKAGDVASIVGRSHRILFYSLGHIQQQKKDMMQKF